MKYRILQYIQPWEIDDLDRQINTMILSSYMIDNPKDIIWEVTMNTDCVDWKNSRIEESYFLNKFRHLKNIVGYYFTEEFNTDDKIRGCTDLRRSAINKNQDYIIWLDSDLYFSHLTLPYMIRASESISAQDYILSPQIIKYWDNSWDSIVHEKFLSEPTNHRDYFDLYCLDTLVSGNDIDVKINSDIKFGGGWFNLFTNSLLSKMKLPEEMGPYGADDTYVSFCSKKLGVQQYVLRGVVVSEIGNKYLKEKDYIKPLLEIKTQDKQKISDEEFYKLIKKFYESN